MTEIVSWFCLMVIGFIGLFKLFTELYYHDHPKEYARKHKMERERPQYMVGRIGKIGKEINQNEKEYLYDD